MQPIFDTIVLMIKKRRDYTGSNNPCYRGGRRQRRDGYIDILTKNHPFSRDNYVLEHRLVMEKYIGRFLNRDEVVHHKNGIKDDNRIENLELFSRSEHAFEHEWGKINKGRKQTEEHKKKIGLANHLIWQQKRNA